MTKLTVESLRAIGCQVIHVDTADRRGLENLGRLELRNVLLGLRYAGQIWWTAFRKRPDITVLPISQATLPFLRDCLWAAGPLSAGSSVVLHLHGSYFGTFYRKGSRLVKALVRWLGRRTWRALVLAPAGVSTLEGIVPTEQIRVLPNAVADVHEVATRHGMPLDGPFRVLYLSNLVRSKGYLDVLRAAKFLVEIKDLEVLLAGAWFDGREEAEALLRSPVLRGRLRYLGVVTGQAKAELLVQSHVLVFPTYYPFEGQPLVLLEAMAAGLPIISTCHAFVPDTVVAGENALFIPPRDPGALAEAVLSLYRDAERRRSMGLASRALYLDRYTPARFRDHLARLLAEAIVTERRGRQ